MPKNFEVSARLGAEPFFVVEADEYDSAFFDKRSKFVHYSPRTAILNNLEFDHADIFDDLAAIQKQFHHLVRTIPSTGLIIMPEGHQALDQVLELGVWTPVETCSMGGQSDWAARLVKTDGSEFEVFCQGHSVGTVSWAHTGTHNVLNALAALAAARHAGVKPQDAVRALNRFAGVKRRMEVVGTVNQITLYDDFAHHPTAIELTLQGLRRKVGEESCIWAVIEPRSNTMRLGVHKSRLAPATREASQVIWYQPEGLDWALDEVVVQSSVPARLLHSIDGIIETICQEAHAGDHIVIMSNGGFGGIHTRLLQALSRQEH